MANRLKSVFLTFVRHRHRDLKTWKDDSVKYSNVNYYPRNEKHVDPPIIPAKVFMIVRVKPFKGNPWWERDTLTQLGIKEDVIEPVFVKNTPEMCRQLWSVKHLIKIVPVVLPDGQLEFNESMEYYIHEDGTVHIGGKLDPARLEASEKFRNSMKRLDYATISEKLRLRWLNGSLV